MSTRPWNKRISVAERKSEEARVAQAQGERERASQKIRYDAMVELAELSKKWSQSR